MKRSCGTAIPIFMKIFSYDKDGYDLKGVDRDGYCRNGEKWEDPDEQIYPLKSVSRYDFHNMATRGDYSKDFSYIKVNLAEFLTPHTEKSKVDIENARCHYLYCLQDCTNLSDWFKDSRDFSCVKIHNHLILATSPVLVVSMDGRYNMVYIKASPENPIYISKDYGVYDFIENDRLSIEYLMYCIRKKATNSCAITKGHEERKYWVGERDLDLFLKLAISFPSGENSVAFQQCIIDMAKNDRTTLSEGTLLKSNRYRIKSILGAGAFGITYLALDTTSDIDVVIKEFFPKLLAYRNADCSLTYVRFGEAKEHCDNAKAKFIGESRKLMRFNDHPNIVKVIDSFEDNCTHYYVMEYIKGKSVDQIQKELPGDIFPPDKAVEYILQIGNALTEMHKQRLTHLDIKPQNILLTDDGRAVLIDFGGAKEYDYMCVEHSSHGNVRTLGYCAPEQIIRPTHFSPKTDVFSLGMTLCMMLYNSLPEIYTDFYTSEPDHTKKSLKDKLLYKLLPLALSKAVAKDLKSRCTLKEFLTILNNVLYLANNA